MQRRDLLKMIAAVTGAAFVGSKAFGYTQVADVGIKDTAFNQNDVDFFNAVGEVIIPKTNTPGAKQANVGVMMAIIVNDCYSAEQRALFKSGMDVIKLNAQSEHQRDFNQLVAADKLALLAQLDEQAIVYNEKANLTDDDDALPHFFTLIKQLVLFCFFTSEIGATQVLRHVAIPGSYNGNLTYAKGDRAWSM